MSLINLKYQFLKLGKPCPRKAELLGFFITHHKRLPKSFLAYETMHAKNGRIVYYPMPVCKLIVLFFKALDGSQKTFSVCRIYTRKREKYYKGKISNVFDVKINGFSHERIREEEAVY